MDQKIQELVTALLEGSATEEEREELKEWIRQSEENRKELEQYEGIWNALEILKNKDNYYPQKGYEQFLSRTEKKISMKPLKQFLRIAAGLILIVSFSFLLWHYIKSDKATTAFFEIRTPKGSHTQITLTDGTVVWLNADSKLKYPDKFEGNTRTVYLEGEAFFNVKKDPSHPFIVHTSDVNVKALGTSFNVKAYPKEGSIETTLLTGIVVIEGNKPAENKEKLETVKLLPNQRATFIKTSGKLLLNDHEQTELKKTSTLAHSSNREKESIIVTPEVNTELYTSWIDNRLVFENETFESIAYKLERRYGATIVFRDNKIKKYRFSGKFPEISIDRALNVLQFASPFEYKIKQDTIFIK